ncbi:MAG: sulfotransferase family 2 domain-containing protein [Chthoniobacterales bacterium]
MISFQKRFLFVHVPKTAGNSIQAILRHYSEDEIVARPEQDGVERFGVRNPKFKVRKHSTLAEYRAALGAEKFDSLYKFVCVRNPWDRMISYYFSPHRETATWDKKAFAKMVSTTLPVAEHLRLNKNDADPFANVDRVLRFESLTKDFQVVCARLDIPTASLPAYNRSARKHYSVYYDDELRELVRRRFDAEIDRFGYRFEQGS